MSTIAEFAPRMPTRYLRDFFSEKEIPEVTWDLRDESGMWHHVPNAVVVEAITGCPPSEVRAIESVLRRIDVVNGDVNHFLRHLAGALIGGAA